jgi:hypothetical protein
MSLPSACGSAVSHINAAALAADRLCIACRFTGSGFKEVAICVGHVCDRRPVRAPGPVGRSSRRGARVACMGGRRGCVSALYALRAGH